MPSGLAWQTLLFVVGLLLLYLGASGMVRGAAALARALHIRPVVIGLTVIAFGTSAPELVVSLLAATRHSAALAVGNVVGSNIANIGLILGLAALLRPLRVERGLIRKEVPMMLAASVLFYLFALSSQITRLDGALLFLGLLAFLTYSLLTAKQQPEEFSPLAELVELEAPRTGSLLRNSLLLTFGLLGLLAGAQLMVSSAVIIARALGIGEGIIGLTLVAGGTSLPELATSAVAALKRESDISVGNIVGSNLFNILAVIGLVALVQPLPVEPSWLRVQFPIMLLFSFALIPILIRNEVPRWEGALLLSGYVAFLAWLF